MFRINPLIRWIAIGVLSALSLAASFRAITSLAKGMPSRSISLAVARPKTDSLSLPPAFHLTPATPSLAQKPQASIAPATAPSSKALPPLNLPQKPQASIAPATAPVRVVPMVAPASIPVANSPVIRVKVASSPTSLTIATSNQGAIVLPDGQAAVGLVPSQSYLVSIARGGILIGDQVFPNGVMLQPGANGLTWVAGYWYRGRVRLVWDAGQLNAVNEVDLEHYLYGVLGAEMPSDWEAEALKAQAIVARSYALTLIEEPISSYWDLGNDESNQCYRGVETETNRTIAAVAATHRTVLVKEGRIFRSQYASTDAISQEAHGGIGKSMSQAGAQKLATQGATMLQILGYYYPGSGLGVLNLSQAAS